jgi:hypothetical protein
MDGNGGGGGGGGPGKQPLGGGGAAPGKKHAAPPAPPPEPTLLKGVALSGHEQVMVHPLVLLSVVDHYYRVAKDSKNKRVVGVILGDTVAGRTDVTNSFAVPFEEDPKDPSVFFLDHDYLETMSVMFRKVRFLGLLRPPSPPPSPHAPHPPPFPPLPTPPTPPPQTHTHTDRRLGAHRGLLLHGPAHQARGHAD